jgi:hypothetical protein
MTKTEQIRVLAWRLKVLREASAAPRNVSPGLSPLWTLTWSFYKWNARHEAHGGSLRGEIVRPRYCNIPYFLIAASP